MSDTVHTIPVGDLIEHDTSGEPCVCGPDVEAVFRDDGSTGWLVVHHSLDGREFKERSADFERGRLAAWRMWARRKGQRP